MDLAALMIQHASPAVVAAGFAVALVLSLLAAEERDMRRGVRSFVDRARR